MGENRDKNVSVDKKNSISYELLTKIFPRITWIILLGMCFLQMAVENYMGVQRDLYYRVSKLEKSILSPEMISIYKWIIIIFVVLSFGVFVYSLFKNNELYKKTILNGKTHYKTMRYFIFYIAISIFSLSLISYYDKAEWITYPLVVMSSVIMVIVYYIRLIYWIKININEVNEIKD